MHQRKLWRMWWSGILATLTFGHLLRVLGDIPVTIGAIAIPIWVNWAIFLLAGLGSAWLMGWALEAEEPAPQPRPPWMALGGYHPTVLAKADHRENGEAYCGITVGYAFVDEEREGDDE